MFIISIHYLYSLFAPYLLRPFYVKFALIMLDGAQLALIVL